jgi:hypothetical protein
MTTTPSELEGPVPITADSGAFQVAVEPSAPSLPGDHTLAVLVELGLESTELLQTGVARQSAAG